jgi:hypothetical protein
MEILIGRWISCSTVRTHATRRRDDDDDTDATGRIVCPQGGGRGVGADFLEVSKVFPVCVGGGRFVNCDPSFLFLFYFLSRAKTS